MELPHSQQQIVKQMPDFGFGEDKNDYIKRCMAWAGEAGYNTVEVVALAKIKWQSFWIERTMMEIQSGNEHALRDAVVMLLKDRYVI